MESTLLILPREAVKKPPDTLRYALKPLREPAKDPNLHRGVCGDFEAENGEASRQEF